MKFHSFTLMVLALLSSFANAEPLGANLERATIKVGELQREYLIQAPQESKRGSRPLLLLLHGHGGSASQLMGLGGRAAPFQPWLQIAQANDAVLIAADGSIGADGKRGWNDLRGVEYNPTTDDLAFVRALIGHAVAQYGANSAEVYLVGISNGGHMTLRVALEAPELVTGIGVVVAAMPANYAGPVPSQAINVAIMNGTRDGFVPYTGGAMRRDRGEVLSTEASFDYWAKANRCSGQAALYRYDNINKRDRSKVIRTQHNRCASGARVTLFEVRGAGHSTPSTSQRYKPIYRMLTGPQNWDIEAAEEIWAALKRR